MTAAKTSTFKFQFTPLREGRPRQMGTFATTSAFQFTPLREGRPGSGRRVQRLPFHFNSRPSARGDCARRKARKSSRTFQFTPLREGRHDAAGRAIEAADISIHAPPRGATRQAFPFPAPRHFNSRPSARGDTASIPFPSAPAFQFTPLREGRRFTSRCPAPRKIFQFTPLREGRRSRRHSASKSRYFNSRPSARGDDGVRLVLAVRPISIHAPPRGATCACSYCRKRRSYFNSRPSARGDLTPCSQKCTRRNFNSRPSARGDAPRRNVHKGINAISIHAPPRGATVERHAVEVSNAFQFTPLREGRHVCWRPRSRSQAISIHAPPRGATPP